MYAAAQDASSPMTLVIFAVVMVFTLIIFASFLLLLFKQYKRCPPKRFLVIIGKTPGAIGSSSRVIHDGAVFVWPLIQDYAYLSLEPMETELPKHLRGSAVEKGIKLPQTWSFAIGTTPELMNNAAIRLLSLPPQDIQHLASDIIHGRIERELSALTDAVSPQEAAELFDSWAIDINADLAELGLVTIGYK